MNLKKIKTYLLVYVFVFVVAKLYTAIVSIRYIASQSWSSWLY